MRPMGARAAAPLLLPLLLHLAADEGHALCSSKPSHVQLQFPSRQLSPHMVMPSARLGQFTNSRYAPLRYELVPPTASRVSKGPLRPKQRSCLDNIRMLRDSYDVVVIGGGPVGITAVLRAATIGRTAILVDATPREQFQFTGPTGLFSKALRDAALRLDVSVLRSMGIGDAAIWAQVRELVDLIKKKAGENNADALTLSRVPHLRGKGALDTGDHESNDGLRTVRVTVSARQCELVKAKNVLLCT
eukprot:2369769-Pleurochrysis_carterae.AAC.4